MGYGVAVFRAGDMSVARQALAVRTEVAPLGLLKPDHIRRVTLYGGDVESGPVAPGVLPAHVVKRPPDVEAHNPEHGSAQTLIHVLSGTYSQFYPHRLSAWLYL
jgi:hypothetical protein